MKKVLSIILGVLRLLVGLHDTAHKQQPESDCKCNKQSDDNKNNVF